MFAAVVVWGAGSRLSFYVDAIAKKLKIGPAFAGMLLLGGITSLPELATVTTSSLTGNAPLAVNNLLGSAAVNVLLLAVADIVYGRGALTSVVAKPATLLQGVLGMMLLSLVAIIVVSGDYPLFGVGAGSIVVALGALLAIRVAAGFEQRRVWQPAEDAEGDNDEPKKEEGKETYPLRRLILVTAGLGLLILLAGVALSQSADAIATKTGISSGMVGFVLVSFATSLPELSSIIAAVRQKRYELAVGDIFGTNLFNLMLLLLADAVASGEPVLGSAGTFEALGALLALLMTGCFTVGLLERRDRTVWRMGYDAAGSLLLFCCGMLVMARFAQ
ncbi:sodium:calcium antiporter [Sphingobium indicum]|uniref:sodium:calcium antiporter n=1 Tax=Sphingobium indicum TaxID=332055 RepID=UPI000B2DE914|nr:sodium:calcium antiporter [Sphingobium indicum]